MPPLERLIAIVARLRSPGGCPWDRAQDPRSLRPYLVEEAYEVVEAIEAGRPEGLREELGDLLFQIVLLARMAEEAGDFDIRDVAAGISEKMLRRHPHVFDPEHREEDAGSMAAWEARKARERGAGGSILSGLPAALPALVRAHRVGEKAARVSPERADRPSALAAIRAGVDALEGALRAGEPEATERAYGEALLALSSLGRFIGVGPEEALRGACGRFEARIRAAERGAGDKKP